jgi:hypothetical protein
LGNNFHNIVKIISQNIYNEKGARSNISLKLDNSYGVFGMFFA